MKIKQLSIFLENKPGHLSKPCRLLAAAGVNILTTTVADTQQFGILRVICRDWQCAKEVLEEAGHVVKVTEVVAIEVEDAPGSLADVLEVIDTLHINVEYMYAFSSGHHTQGILVFRFDDPDQAIAALQEHKITIVSSDEALDRAEK